MTTETTKVKYIVTDPCYILNAEQWGECCGLMPFQSNVGWEKFYDRINKFLHKITGHKAWSSDTGFGDWSNSIDIGEDIERGGFTADAGCVCVCRMPEPGKSEKLDEILENSPHCVAIFYASEEIEVTFSGKDRRWTVVHIEDKITGNKWETMRDDDGWDEEFYDDDVEDSFEKRLMDLQLEYLNKGWEPKDIPSWALNYLINGDKQQLTDEEIQQCDEFMTEWLIGSSECSAYNYKYGSAKKYNDYGSSTFIGIPDIGDGRTKAECETYYCKHRRSN